MGTFQEPLHYEHTFNLPHTETAGLQKKYAATIEFYHYIFQEKPDEWVWPAPLRRFSAENSKFMWFSVHRTLHLFKRCGQRALVVPAQSLFEFFTEHYCVSSQQVP